MKLPKTIASLKIGESATVVDFTDEVLSLKLLEMGVLPGTKVTLSQMAPLGDPIAVRINHYQLALRREEANTVIVV